MSAQPPQQPYPQEGQPYPQGGQPAYGQPTYGQEGPADGRRKSRKPVYIAAGVTAALLVGGGGAFAVNTLSGGGAQPADALPGNAIGYYRMDIDPSAGQKISAVRFMDKLPKDKVDITRGDFRKNLFELAKDDSSELKGIDYDKDIKPWLGDRMGVSISAPVAGGKDPVVAVAIQVKDEDKARQGIDKLTAATKSGSSSGSSGTKAVAQTNTAYFFHGDYAVFTQDGQQDALEKAINDSPLSKNSTFTKDMGDLGEQGIMSAWADLGQAATQFATSDNLSRLDRSGSNRLGPALDNLKKSGRTAAALRFDKDYVELAGITRGQSALKKPQDAPTSQLGHLPGDTAVAVSLTGADQLVDAGWNQLMTLAGDGSGSAQQQLDDIKAQYGIALPDDVKTLVGRNLVLAAPDQNLTSTSSSDDVSVGASITTDAGKAEDVVGKLQKIAEDQGSPFPLSHKADGDQFYVATNDRYLGQISTKGDLGSSEAFTLAVPDAESSQYAVYVDLDKVEHHYLDQIKDSRAREVVKSFCSFGASAHVTGDGESAFSVRLVSN